MELLTGKRKRLERLTGRLMGMMDVRNRLHFLDISSRDRNTVRDAINRDIERVQEQIDNERASE